MNCKEYQEDLRIKAANDKAAQETQKMLEVRNYMWTIAEHIAVVLCLTVIKSTAQLLVCVYNSIHLSSHRNILKELVNVNVLLLLLNIIGHD